MDQTTELQEKKIYSLPVCKWVFAPRSSITGTVLGRDLIMSSWSPLLIMTVVAALFQPWPIKVLSASLTTLMVNILFL